MENNVANVEDLELLALEVKDLRQRIQRIKWRLTSALASLEYGMGFNGNTFLIEAKREVESAIDLAE